LPSENKELKKELEEKVEVINKLLKEKIHKGMQGENLPEITEIIEKMDKIEKVVEIVEKFV
jgi:hypothetical protein